MPALKVFRSELLWIQFYIVQLVLTLLVGSELASAQVNQPTLDQVNKLFDFAQDTQPGSFYPPVKTQQANELGVDWFFRFYPGSKTYAAVSINGSGEYAAGKVFVLGGPFGKDILYVESLATLLTMIEAAQRLDDDGDGVANAFDEFPEDQTRHSAINIRQTEMVVSIPELTNEES